MPIAIPSEPYTGAIIICSSCKVPVYNLTTKGAMCIKCGELLPYHESIGGYEKSMGYVYLKKEYIGKFESTEVVM